eukprot:TRINITY_DN28069_c0_g1_i3.p1 TRINITY_DN28069_c0_g1~~TRINITY_DN28069_c0_g1_i3.p1  ORF type:complete len:182 (-),score=38.72 TRINITY_DN28069_c0_g1_i3:28-573(-)
MLPLFLYARGPKITMQRTRISAEADWRVDYDSGAALRHGEQRDRSGVLHARPQRRRQVGPGGDPGGPAPHGGAGDGPGYPGGGPPPGGDDDPADGDDDGAPLDAGGKMHPGGPGGTGGDVDELGVSSGSGGLPTKTLTSLSSATLPDDPQDGLGMPSLEELDEYKADDSNVTAAALLAGDA